MKTHGNSGTTTATWVQINYMVTQLARTPVGGCMKAPQSWKSFVGCLKHENRQHMTDWKGCWHIFFGVPVKRNSNTWLEMIIPTWFSPRTGKLCSHIWSKTCISQAQNQHLCNHLTIQICGWPRGICASVKWKGRHWPSTWSPSSWSSLIGSGKMVRAKIHGGFCGFHGTSSIKRLGQKHLLWGANIPMMLESSSVPPKPMLKSSTPSSSAVPWGIIGG